MRFWAWINANTAALQALGGILSGFLGLPTIVVLLITNRAASRAAKAANEQAEAAKAQVASAEVATEVARLQLEAARDSAAAEREHSSLIKQQTLASLRPVLLFVCRPGMHFSAYILENQSEALALDIQAWNGTVDTLGEPLQLGQTVLGGRAETTIDKLNFGPYEVEAGRFQYKNVAPLFAKYRSQDGRSFITQLADLHSRPWLQSVEEELPFTAHT